VSTDKRTKPINGKINRKEQFKAATLLGEDGAPGKGEFKSEKHRKTKPPNRIEGNSDWPETASDNEAEKAIGSSSAREKDAFDQSGNDFVQQRKKKYCGRGKGSGSSSSRKGGQKLVVQKGFPKGSVLSKISSLPLGSSDVSTAENDTCSEVGRLTGRRFRVQGVKGGEGQS